MQPGRPAGGIPKERTLGLSPRPPERGGLSYVLVYPNRHAVGMANLGYQAVFGLLAEAAGASCHRAFADFPAAVETGRGLRDHDVLCLSLSFEGDYPEALGLLARARVPLRAADRGPRDPLVLAGGVAVSLNPEPLAPFVDVVFVGEAEAGLPALHDFLRRHRGAPRGDLLAALQGAGLPGVYVPSLREGATRVRRAVAEVPWEPARSRVVAPGDAFGGAYLLEVSRGCPHACRFCAAGYATRPTRFLPLEVLEPWARFGAREVGRVGLVGAAVSDYPGFRELAGLLLAEGAGFTVSSFRAENLDEETLALLARGGLKTLTVALEAGSERLRRLLGKGLGPEDLLRAARLAAGAGLRSLRVYGMIGLPGEGEEDVRALAEAARACHEALGGGTVTLSVAPFVPKPHTPLQWEPMAPEPLLRERVRLLEKLLGRRTALRVVAEAPKWSRVQGLLARGGREVADLLEAGALSGDWRAALRSPEAAAVLDRARDPAEPLPWDFLDGHPSRESLLRERQAALRGEPPCPCRPGTCRVCGVCPDPSAG